MAAKMQKGHALGARNALNRAMRERESVCVYERECACERTKACVSMCVREKENMCEYVCL